MAQNQTDLTVSIDSGLKASAEAFFRSHGLSFSDGMTALLKDAVEQGKMPIDEPDDEIWDPAEIRQASADIRAGRLKTIPWEQVKAELHAVQD